MSHQYHTHLHSGREKPSLPSPTLPFPPQSSTLPTSELKKMLSDNRNNSSETLRIEWQNRRCNPTPFLGFIMSMVIRRQPVGRVSTEPGSNSTSHSQSKALFADQSNPFFLGKTAMFNSRIKSPRSQRWHLAKATEERAGRTYTPNTGFETQGVMFTSSGSNENRLLEPCFHENNNIEEHLQLPPFLSLSIL